MKRKIAIVLLVVLTAATFAACNADQPPPNLNTYIIGNPKPSSNVIVTPQPSAEAKGTDVTEEKYDQINEGMSYDEVVAIIGAEGKAGGKRGKVTPYSWFGFTPMSKTVQMNFNEEMVLVSKDPLKSNKAAASGTFAAP